VATVAISPAFIEGLADLVAGATAVEPGGRVTFCSAEGGRVCPADRTGCGLAGID